MEIPGYQNQTQSQAQHQLNRRIEWIAVFLTILNFVVMLFSYSMYYRDEGWGVFSVTISIVAAVILLFTIIFSLFDKVMLSKISISLGILFLMVSIVSLGLKLIDEIANGYYGLM